MNRVRPTHFTSRILAYLGSTRLMALLFLALGVAMGWATFIENDLGTPAAQALVYRAWWFEGLMLLFVVNFLLNIRKYGLEKRRKWPVLLVHASLVIIILGAFVTRYFGYTGLMTIREGEVSNTVYSDEAYLRVAMEEPRGSTPTRRIIERPVLLSGATPWHNRFELHTEFNGSPIQVSYRDFIPDARYRFREQTGGALYLRIVETHRDERHEHYLREGVKTNFHGHLFTLNAPQPGAFNFTYISDTLYLSPFRAGSHTDMVSRESTPLPRRVNERARRGLYRFGDLQFALSAPPQGGHTPVGTRKG